ncbi:netrin receptor unc-40-like [Amphiura filiformis]|uniref:netrin receptor unc-40-like n=1 Tax=Amphiura filiformis TaxID=82378 RepID=UPI003B20F39B
MTENVDFYVAPETVEAVQLKENILTWDEPESTCAVIGYSVIVTLINIGQCKPTNRQVADTAVVVPNITLPGMDFFSTYQVSIQAWSGNSSFARGGANTMEFETPEAAPSGPPQKVRNNSPEDGQITFTWDLPSCGQRNGQIVKYEYAYWTQYLKHDVKKGSTTREEITLSGLLSNETYVFQVRAYTKEGPGPFSELYLASVSGSTRGSTSDSRLIAITTPLAIITVIAVILVVFLLIYPQTCCKHCFRDTRTLSTPQPQPDVTNTDNTAYEDLDQGTLEKQQAYMDLDDPYLTPMSESMVTETSNQQLEYTDGDERCDDNVGDQVTYEDIF